MLKKAKDNWSIIDQLRPEGIPLPRDLKPHNNGTIGKFTKHEVEMTAWRLVQFFQVTNAWGEFRPSKLREFYLKHGWDPDTMFFGLKGPWFDDGGMGAIVHFDAPFIVECSNGCHYLTTVFVERCLEK